MSTPRAPESVRAHLREALRLLCKGPEGALIGPDANDPKYSEGYRARGHHEAGWRSSWIEPELRRVLAWMDGAETARDIEVFRNGMDYGKDKP
jgi:hypothetical protein